MKVSKQIQEKLLQHAKNVIDKYLHSQDYDYKLTILGTEYGVVPAGQVVIISYDGIYYKVKTKDFTYQDEFPPRLEPVSDVHAIFEVSNSGVVTVLDNSTLDYETTATYNFVEAASTSTEVQVVEGMEWQVTDLDDTISVVYGVEGFNLGS